MLTSEANYLLLFNESLGFGLDILPLSYLKKS